MGGRKGGAAIPNLRDEKGPKRREGNHGGANESNPH